ncbi:MAG: hypothetical protein RLZZ156_485 [Deinococcota bacterium]|jgi:hypothetical protein
MAKKQITAWVSDEVYAALKAQAEKEKGDLSPLTARVLARAIADGVQGSPRYSPVVEAFKEAVGVATRAEIELVAECASKAALYAMAGRTEVGQLLTKKLGEQGAKTVQQEAWRRAVEDLRKPLEGES